MSDIKLPPLPAEFATLHHDDGFFTTKIREEHAGKVFRTAVYNSEQMQAYARAAVEADRAQRVPDGADATAYRYCHRCGYKSETVVITKAAAPPVAQPAERKPLTDMQINEAYRDADVQWGEVKYFDVVRIVRAIERAHGIGD